MKVLTWNILAAEWVKKSYYPGADAAVIFNSKARFARICEILKEADADVIMLQEVMKREYEQLVLLFGKQYFISELKKMVWRDNTNSESGNVTFLKRSLFPKQHIYHYPREYGTNNGMIYTGFHEKRGAAALSRAILTTNIGKNARCIIHLGLKHIIYAQPTTLSAK